MYIQSINTSNTPNMPNFDMACDEDAFQITITQNNSVLFTAASPLPIESKHPNKQLKFTWMNLL